MTNQQANLNMLLARYFGSTRLYDKVPKECQKKGQPGSSNKKDSNYESPDDPGMKDMNEFKWMLKKRGYEIHGGNLQRTRVGRNLPRWAAVELDSDSDSDLEATSSSFSPQQSAKTTATPTPNAQAETEKKTRQEREQQFRRLRLGGAGGAQTDHRSDEKEAPEQNDKK